jgi:hypothetical protein
MNVTMPDINGSLKRFNSWWDIFILEAIKPLGMLSLGLGTLAVFSVEGLAISPWFVISWAIVQALSIDGLFFVTWDRLFSQKLMWSNLLASMGLALIGTIMLLVAIAINAIIGFQVLWLIPSSQVAMARLGISPELFTAGRAALAGVVFVMISFVRARAKVNEPTPVSSPALSKKARISPVVTVRESKPLELPEIAQSNEEADFVLTSSNSHSHKKELIKNALTEKVATGEKINMRVLADEIEVSYSYVKLVKKELGIE